MEQGNKETAGLLKFLMNNGRNEEAVRAINDEGFLEKMLADYRAGLLTAKWIWDVLPDRSGGAYRAFSCDSVENAAEDAFHPADDTAAYGLDSFPGAP